MANISNCFDINFVFLKIFGLWRDKSSGKIYKYYSFIYLFLTLPVYLSLLTLNLLFTPRKIELMIREMIFYFTDLSVVTKAIMILRKRDQIVEALNILDCEAFEGEDDVSRKINQRYVTLYKRFWKLNCYLSNFTYWSQIVLSVLKHYLFGSDFELPICKYYFLDEEMINRYFIIWWLYQCVGMCGHMMYNVNIDSLISGFIMMAIAQVDILNHEISSNISLSINEIAVENREAELKSKLNRYLKHYEVLLELSSAIQDIISLTMFIQFGVASITICAILCNISLSSSNGALIVLAPYFATMVIQIFLPAFLGTWLSFKSRELVNAAYFSDWIPRSESFKRSLRLFMQRADTSILLTGCGLFPLTLDTFTSIMKSAYSFFTVLRSLQDRD